MSLRATPARAAGLAILLALVASGCGHEDVRLSIAAPQDGQTVRTSKLRVQGKVKPADARVRINKRPVRLRGGTFQTTVRLHRGHNRINVTAKSVGRTTDIKDIIVLRARTRAEIAAAGRRREARRAAASAARAARAARAAVRRAASRRAGVRYPAEFRRSFMASCQVHANAAYCGCTLSYLENHVPASDLGQLQAQLFSTGSLPKPLLTAAVVCSSKA